MEAKQTLGAWREESRDDPELGALLSSQISRAENAANGRSFDDVKIRGVEEMGEAAGTCAMCSGEIRVREDVVATEAGVRENLAHVLVHEAAHAEGIEQDGIAELAVSIKLGMPPVPAYRRKFEHAQHLAETIGRERVIELAKRPEAKVLLLRAYVQARVARGVSQGDIEKVAEETEDHVKMAA